MMHQIPPTHGRSTWQFDLSAGQKMFCTCLGIVLKPKMQHETKPKCSVLALLSSLRHNRFICIFGFFTRTFCLAGLTSSNLQTLRCTQISGPLMSTEMTSLIPCFVNMKDMNFDTSHALQNTSTHQTKLDLLRDPSGTESC